MGWLDKLFGGPKVYPTSVRTMAQFRAEVVESETPVIVDVWSETCPPCKRLVPVIIELATRYEGKVGVVEISATAERELLGALRIRATPTILVFEGGEEFLRVTGYRPPSWFHEMIAVEFPEIA